MLKDKPFTIKLNLPAMANGDKASASLSKLNIGFAVQQGLVITPKELPANITKVEKQRVEGKDEYDVVAFAGGTVTQNSVAYVDAQVLSQLDELTLTVVSEE